MSPTPYDHQVLVPDDAAYKQVLSHGFILAVPGRDIRSPDVVFTLSTPKGHEVVHGDFDPTPG